MSDLDLSRILPDAAPPPGARERVRAGVARRLGSARRRRLALAWSGAACAVASGVAIVLLALGPAPGQQGAPLAPGVLALPSRATVYIREGSDVALIEDGARGATLRLRRGMILAQVAKRRPGAPFVVLAGDARVEVIGTLFAVGVDETGAASVRGFEGVVAVTRGGVTVRVGVGESVGPGVVVNAEELARLSPAPPAPPAPPSVPAPAAPVAPAAAPATRDAAEPRPLRSAPTQPPPPSPYAQAKQLEEAGRLQEALEAYASVASSPGEHAEDALYAAGRLQIGALRDPDGASAAFRGYRERFPAGRYARAVDAHLLDLAVAARDYDAMDREATRFLAEHADDPRAPRFHVARAAARIHRGDCKGALEDLARAPRSPGAADLRKRCE